jgi:hypothetical protein
VVRCVAIVASTGLGSWRGLLNFWGVGWRIKSRFPSTSLRACPELAEGAGSHRASARFGMTRNHGNE